MAYRFENTNVVGLRRHRESLESFDDIVGPLDVPHTEE